jgi:splicing factor U2AF subunit
VFNLPPNVNDDEIKQYFFTLLTTLNPNTIGSPILSIEKRDEGYYYIFELATKDDIEIMINMNNTEWRGYRIRIQKPKSFFSDYNDMQGNNVKKKEVKHNTSLLFDSDNKLYMGGIPVTAKEADIRNVVESFGQVKTFNLVKDPSNPDLNRGFCFFEYADEKVTEKAIKGLNILDMGDKRLKVQRATVNAKSFSILQQLKANPVQMTVNEPGKSNFSEQAPDITLDQIDIPLYASIPSRVIQIINVTCAEDVMDDLEYREIVEDVRNVKLTFNFRNACNMELF